jgi:hypothetical protein
MVVYESQSAISPATRRCGGLEGEFPPGSVGDQIRDFLDGRTCGEELFHELYDHVLYEAIPEQMRSLFK